MTRGETLKLIFLIKQLYPGKNGFVSMGESELKATAETWSMMLEDVDFGLAQQALKRHASLSSFAPSIAELRKEAVSAVAGEKITGDEAWEIILSAVRKYGYARKQEGISQMPETVQPMARRWFDEICVTENDVLGVTRGQFLKAWAIHEDKEQTMKQLPGGISEAITKMLQEKRMLLEAEV